MDGREKWEQKEFGKSVLTTQHGDDGIVLVVKAFYSNPNKLLSGRFLSNRKLSWSSGQVVKMLDLKSNGRIPHSFEFLAAACLFCAQVNFVDSFIVDKNML